MSENEMSNDFSRGFAQQKVEMSEEKRAVLTIAYRGELFYVDLWFNHCDHQRIMTWLTQPPNDEQAVKWLCELVRRLAHEPCRDEKGYKCDWCFGNTDPVPEPYATYHRHNDCHFTNKFVKVVLGTGCLDYECNILNDDGIELCYDPSENQCTDCEEVPIPALADLVKVCQELGVEITHE